MTAPPGWVAAPPGAPGRGPWREVDRWQWWPADGGDPWALLQRWLVTRGFPVLDLSLDRDVDAEDQRGVALLLGAGAGAVAIGAPAGRRSPVPGVPEIAAILLEPASGAGAAPGAGRARRWREQWSAPAHERAVAEVRSRIAAGEVYQVNIVSSWVSEITGDPAGSLAAVPGLTAATWRGALQGPGWAVASASPETLLRVSGGVISSQPVKGTVAIGADRAVSRQALATSLKDRAEHVMIVDLVRNDLAKVARVGSVAVSELYDVQPWAGLWHAHSTVTGTVLPGTSLAAVLRAVLPGGSVTGAPKRAALEVIAELEPVGRGPSMGALGWLTPAGRLDLGLTIRTAAVDWTGAGPPRAAVWAGGGITWGSEPRGERAEALAKAAPLLAALGGR